MLLSSEKLNITRQWNYWGDERMIDDKMYETCKDCPYCYREVNQCMYGEENVPDNLEKKCEVKNE